MADEHLLLEVTLRDRRTPVKGRQFRIRTFERGDPVSFCLQNYGVWQRPLTVYIGTHLEPGDLFVDVGTQIGYFTLVAATTLGPDGRVYAFEADPDNFARLQENLELNGATQVVARQLAIGERSGEAVLHRSRSAHWGHSLMQKPRLSDRLTVAVESLSEALQEERRPARLVKIDVEGLELHVLEGMAGLIARQGVPPIVIFEYAPLQAERLDPGLVRLRDHIRRHGYRLHAFIAHEGPSITPPPLDPATLLAIHGVLLASGTAAEFDLLLVPQSGERSG